jgi:hypothetical protein
MWKLAITKFNSAQIMEVKYAKINHHKVKICENQPPLSSIEFKSANVSSI